MKITLLALSLMTLLITAPAWAHGDEHHSGDATPAATAPINDLLKTLEEGYTALQEAIATKAFDKIHKIAEGMQPALNALAAANKDDAAITGTVTQIAEVLNALHESGDAKDMAATAAELRKLEGGLKLLKARIPSENKPEAHEKHGANEGGTDNPLQAALAESTVLKPAKSNEIVIKLTDGGGNPVSLEGLKEVHTKKVHLLVADETLTDYQHLHPEPGTQAGTYVTSFVPENPTSYKVWLDVTPAGGNQQFIPISLKGEAPCASSCVKKSLASEGTSDALTATIAFEKILKAGVAEMGTLTIKDKEGRPVTNLEPVMGAFAHIVGFYEDFQTVAHIHPMGQEPKSNNERGGPELQFHIEPAKKGFLKLYAQVRRGDKDIFIPFGMNIE